MQSTAHIWMVRPLRFEYNEQTSESNAFQQKGTALQNSRHVQERSLREFDNLTRILENNGVDVHITEDSPEPHTPDSIFPNNWLSFHEDGRVFLYPMMAENRRLERRLDILDQLTAKGFRISGVTDLSYFEKEGRFLEGSGSMVLDRVNRLAYACLSPRTNEPALDRFCSEAGYRSIVFRAFGRNGIPVYHTNVMMCIGTKLAVICAESITDTEERNKVLNTLRASGREIAAISLEQMNHFAGNMLELKNLQGETLMVMSEQALLSLKDEQARQISSFCRIIHSPIPTIEKNGGGSVRCMIAEIHLPR